MTNKDTTPRGSVLIELFGWYGIGAISTAYVLLSFQIIDSNTVWYQILNLSGACGIIISSYRKKDYQPVVLNIVWALIAMVALITVLV